MLSSKYHKVKIKITVCWKLFCQIRSPLRAIYENDTLLQLSCSQILLSYRMYHHCIKYVRIRSYSGPHFSRIFPHLDWIWRYTPYLSVFSPNIGKCGKNADQNTSEYGHFFAVSILLSIDYILWTFETIHNLYSFLCFWIFVFCHFRIVNKTCPYGHQIYQGGDIRQGAPTRRVNSQS